jgi:glycosyltransferase involved in cell wall biosynthesis
MDWRPNQDAIRWFIKDVHPLLKSSINYRLYVAGREPPRWLLDPSFTPAEVTVTGTVADIRPWIARGSVYVVPLRTGGGSRLKILEALAMERAVVSTTVGAEGLDVEPARHLLLADTAEDFARTVLALLADPERRRMLGRAGRELVESRYAWDRIASIQGDLWRRVAAGARNGQPKGPPRACLGIDRQPRIQLR